MDEKFIKKIDNISEIFCAVMAVMSFVFCVIYALIHTFGD